MNCSSCGTKIPDGAGFCVSCGAARPPASTSESAPLFCGSCGTKVGAGIAFCTSCGAAIGGATATAAEAIVAPPTVITTAATSALPPPPNSPPPPPPTEPEIFAPVSGSAKTRWPLFAAIAVVALLAIGGGVYFATKSGSSDTASTKGSTKSATASTVSTVTTIATTTTTLDPVSAAKKANPGLYDLAARLQSVLTQSSAGRGQVGAVVGSVRNCTVTPNTAANEIDQVVANRQSILQQLGSISNTGGTDGTALITTFQNAIRESITADQYYSLWMKYLYANYYYTRPIGCPSGSAPLNADYNTALAASTRATSAKQQFVEKFNPIAESFGLPTWDPGDI